MPGSPCWERKHKQCCVEMTTSTSIPDAAEDNAGILHLPTGEGQKGGGRAYLTHSTVPACLYVVFTLIASIDKAVLALCVQFHQHAQSGPFGAA